MIILDTNVLISGLLSRHKDTPTSRLVRHILAGRTSILASTALLEEYARTVSRVLESGMTDDERRDVCLLIVSRATVIEPPRGTVVCPDPKDQHVWDLLQAQADALLVTGERALLDAEEFSGRVVRAREALESLGIA